MRVSDARSSLTSAATVHGASARVAARGVRGSGSDRRSGGRWWVVSRRAAQEAVPAAVPKVARPSGGPHGAGSTCTGRGVVEKTPVPAPVPTTGEPRTSGREDKRIVRAGLGAEAASSKPVVRPVAGAPDA